MQTPPDKPIPRAYHVGAATVVTAPMPDGTWLATYPTFIEHGATEAEAIASLSAAIAGTARAVALINLRERAASVHLTNADDGDLTSRDPYPARPVLVEEVPERVARYRLSIAARNVRGGYVDREFTATSREAFAAAATEIKNGSPLVLVYEDDKQIAELKLTGGES